ncbi:MAG TPA: peroxiredoxin [Actinomycetes bacterium]|nr:peroxiredoxin [Actinomycetes bacterium]
MDAVSHDPTQLPADLPRPADDGAADHLPGASVPAIVLPATRGGALRVDRVPAGFDRLIVYAYPMTGLPGVDSPPGWDEIPGARGCTPESCGFRDHAAELARGGATVLGLSSQSSDYQAEAADRLRLPFPLLSDERLELSRALGLPTFTVEVDRAHDGGGAKTLLKRLTLVIRNGRVEHVFYPVFPPDRHAAEVLAWVTAHPVGSPG